MSTVLLQEQKRPQLGKMLSNCYCVEGICQAQQSEAVEIHHCGHEVPLYQLGWGRFTDRKRKTLHKVPGRDLPTFSASYGTQRPQNEVQAPCPVYRVFV